MKETQPLLKVKGISKNFGVTKALDDVQLVLKKGQILGLIGENGSGKSTLASIIAAVYTADSGEIYLEEEPYKPSDATVAINLGVCMILQEKGTFDKLSVAKNIFIGREKQFLDKGLINLKRMNKEAQDILNKIGACHIKAEMLNGKLNFEDQKLVELARAMSCHPKILIVDETSTALSRNGRTILYSIINNIREANQSVIFISHDIDELMNVCDELVVLRDGHYIGSVLKESYNSSSIKKMMVGREVDDNLYRKDNESSVRSTEVLRLEGVTAKNIRDIDLTLYKGEILGIGGLTDCGIHDIGRIVFGLEPIKSGKVIAYNKYSITSPKSAMKNKIAYISKNRDQESLMVYSTIKDNIGIASYGKLKKGLFLSPDKENDFVNEWVKKLSIKLNNIEQYVVELSGGNKQKVAVAKWLGFGADILVFDCPTRGIDIGVKANIYKLMTDLRNEGKSIIMISEELPEIIGMSDRTIIVKDGRISGEFVREECLTEVGLIEYMI